MSNISKFHEPLAIAVASGSSIRSAAVAVQCSESRAYALSSEPGFRQRVSEIRSEAVTAAVGRLSSLAVQAVDTLGLMLAESQEPRDRLAAAKAILATLAPLSEFAELRVRIDKLENTASLRIAK